MRSDAHVHLDERMKEVLHRIEIMAMVSCATPQECEEAKAFIKQYPDLDMSCGIHPWYVETTDEGTMFPYLENCTIIGEIGLDNVWCKSDEALQKLRFEQQVSYACKTHKPVILHTKGKEKEIAEIIKNYPNKYLVHWYSCMEYLDLYKNLDCYFSVGPSIDADESVQQIVKEINIHRLLIESDGIGAMEWAFNRRIELDEYVSILDHSAMRIGETKGYSVEEVWEIVNQNYLAFYK